MDLPWDDTRTTALLAVTKRIVFVVGLIAIGSVIDVIPEKVAELCVGGGFCLVLALALAPIDLLNHLAPAASKTVTQSEES